MSEADKLSAPKAAGPLQARWAQLAPREKNLVLMAAALVLGALLWFLLLAPALATLRSADAQARVLQDQLQQMQAMQRQAQALQKQPAPSYEDALRALKVATQQTLGKTAQINVAGQQVNITLQGTGPDALAQWLAQARLNARSLPLEARLVRVTNPTGAVWNGVLVMSLPR